MKKILLPLFFLFILLLCSCSKKTSTKGENKTSISLKDTTTLKTFKEYNEFPCDFEVKSKIGQNEIKILQLTDPQIFELSSAESRAYKYMDYCVNNTNPDLIIVTGDIIYGRYDKDGSLWKNIIHKLDSYGIPWAPVFGNHDNESVVGVDYQIEELLKCSNVLFKRRSELSGNSNYSIGLTIRGKLCHTFYMIDTKGCMMINGDDKNKSPFEFSKKQLSFIKETQENACGYAQKEIKGFLGMHVMLSMVSAAVQTKYNGLITKDVPYKIPENENGDFGEFREKFYSQIDSSGDIFYELLDSGIEGVFVGHNHENNASIYFDGMRLTYGLKSSTCDSHSNDMLGGTLITLDKDHFSVEHIFYKE